MHPKEFIDWTDDDTEIKQSEFIQNLPYIKIKLGNNYVIALIDTGAEFSLVNEQFINKYREELKGKIIPIKNINLVTINKKKINTVKKQLNCDLEIEKYKIKGEMLITSDMTIDLLIGMNILSDNHMIINLEKRVLEYEDVEVPFIKNKQEEEGNKNKTININYVGDYREVRIVENGENKELNCSEDHKELMKEVLKDYEELTNEKQGLARGYTHKLEVINEESFNCKTYPVPQAYKEIVKDEINSMLENRVIEKARTPFINPVVIVKKTDGKIRICLDARQINARTVPQFETPVMIEGIMGKLGNKSVFTKLDLKNSFWLIPLERNSRKYTGFSIDGNVYQFRVVPFGLSTSCAALVRAMQQILNKYDSFCSHYIDDILIFSDDYEKHLEHIQIILDELKENGLKLNLEKCEFFKTEIKFLGYKINLQGITIDKGRLKEIEEYPRPKNLRTLRGLLGVLNYYRKFVDNIAEKSLILHDLLKKGVKWKWTEEHERAFNSLKESFCKNVMIHHPDYSIPFILRTDASDCAIAAELTQTKNGVEIPISFVSRSLRKHERNYTITEKEMAAVVFAVMKLKFYLTGNRFTVETDHGALEHLMKTRFANGRIYRWTLLLQEFNFDIKHIPGKRNIVADSLSRKEIDQAERLNEVVIALNVLNERDGIFSDEYLSREQDNNEEIAEIKNKINNNVEIKKYSIVEGKLCKSIKEEKRYVTTREHALLIGKYFHEEYGHIGMRKLWLMFRETYNCKKDVGVMKKIVSGCHLCCLAKYKNHINRNEVKNIMENEPLGLIAIDFLSNLVRSKGFKHMLIIVDVFTKFTRIYPCKRNNTDTAINCIELFMLELGKPKRILADNATYFTNNRFKNYWLDRNIALSYCSVRHPQGNPSERYVQEVIKYLRIMVYYDRHVNWHNYIAKIEKYINEVPSTVTQETPQVLMKRENPQRPWETEVVTDENFIIRLNKVKDRIRKNNEAYIRKETKKIKKKVQFNIGDKVIVKHLRVANREQGINAKLLLPYEGPYIIGGKFGDTYELRRIQDESIRGKFHIQMLYPYINEE